MFSLESANLCTSESLSKLATDALNDCVQLEITALCSTFTVFLRLFLLFRAGLDLACYASFFIRIVYSLTQFIYIDMSQARLPAEFKHISKRRKRNQMGFP